MPEITLDLSEQQMRALRSASALSGKSLSEIAAQAVSTAVEARYVLPKTAAGVLPFQALKSSPGPGDRS
jgi:hypothetical protein